MSGGMPPEGRSGSGMQALRLWRQVKRSQDDRLSTAEERRLAVRISGALWLSGGLTLLVMLPMPGERIERVWLVAGIAAVRGAARGALLAAVHWDHAPRRLFHVSTALMPVAVAILQALSGGGASPTHQYLWLRVAYAALFFPPVPAVAYGVACSAVSAAPLLYDSGAVEGNLARELLVVVPLFFIVGAIIFAGRRVLGRLSRQATALEREQRRMIDEQSSLRRVATAGAAGAPPGGTLALVSSEVRRLLSADAAAIGRYISERRVHVMGVSHGSTDAGTVLEVHPDDELARVRVAGRPLRIDRYADDAPSRVPRFGYRSFVGAPVHVGGAIWGVLVAGSRVADGFPLGAEKRLRDYADLLATAVSNAEDRTRLDRQAGVDPLTGMPNYRAFRDRLEDEVSRARRHDRPLTVAVVDIDRFGEATDRVGHDESEQSLADVAALVRSAVRDEDVVARLGADELGIAFVESDRAARGRARAAARRAHAAAPRHAPHRVGRAVRPRRRPGRRRAPAPRRRRALLEQGARPRPLLGLRPDRRPRPRRLRPAPRPRARAGPRRAAGARAGDRREGPRHAGALRARRRARRPSRRRAGLARGVRRAPPRGRAAARRRQDRRPGQRAAQARPPRAGRDRAHGRPRRARRADRRRRPRRPAGPLDRGAPRAAGRDRLPARAERPRDPRGRRAARARRRLGQHGVRPRLLAATDDRRCARRVPRARRRAVHGGGGRGARVAARARRPGHGGAADAPADARGGAGGLTPTRPRRPRRARGRAPRAAARRRARRLRSRPRRRAGRTACPRSAAVRRSPCRGRARGGRSGRSSSPSRRRRRRRSATRAGSARP